MDSAYVDCPGFLFWVLLLPRPPTSSRSLRLCPWASTLLHGPLDICLDLLPAAPPPPVQKRDGGICFYSTGGDTRRLFQLTAEHYEYKPLRVIFIILKGFCSPILQKPTLKAFLNPPNKQYSLIGGHCMSESVPGICKLGFQQLFVPERAFS